MIMRILAVLLLFACSEDGTGVEAPVGDPEKPMPPLDPAVRDPACAEELEFFTARIETPILIARCVGCHNSSGVAKTTDLLLTSGDSAANFRAAATVANEIAYGRSVLLLKPSLTHPEGHTGGELVPVGTEGYAELERFVAVASDPSCNPPPAVPLACETILPGPRLLRRLTHSEYRATVRDLLGVELAPSFTADEIVEGFDNDSEALIVSPLYADQAREAAESISQQVALASLLPCDPTAGNETCARTFLESFGLKTFRRPLEQHEVTRYLDLHRTISTTEGFESGIRWTIAALLQSPHFLHRRELGNAAPGSSDYRLDTYEIASALSYGITGTLPDEPLFALAASGELAMPERIASEVVRLFRSPRALDNAERFVSQWLAIDTLDTVPKDATTYPELDATIREKLRRETRLFVSYVLQQGSGTLSELLTADYTFADGALASYYGTTLLPDVEIEGWRMTTPQHAAGLLTQGSFLTTHARPNDASPIHRGVVIRERFLCQELPPPPPGVNAEPPPLDPSQTDRERYSAHSEDQACSSCHRLIDPIGFGFARFDGIGRYRDAFDDSGEIVEGATGTPFTGTRGLAELLASRDDVTDCFARQWLRFSYGTSLEGDLSCSLAFVRNAFRADGKLETLAVALTQTPHFISRTGEPFQAEPDPDPDPPMEEEPPPPPQDSLQIDVRVDSDWGAGYCHQVTATNLTADPLDWSVALDIDGTITSHWNAEASGNAGRVIFSGVTWNDVIGAGEAAAFGFCANR
jgi:hypothetical protein